MDGHIVANENFVNIPPVPMPRASPVSHVDVTMDAKQLKKPVPLPRRNLSSPKKHDEESMNAYKTSNESLEGAITKGYSTLTKSIKNELKSASGNVQEKSKAVIESTKIVSAKIERSVRGILSKRQSVATVQPASNNELKESTNTKVNRCNSLPGEDIFNSITFGSPIDTDSFNDEGCETNSDEGSPPPPEYPPPPLPDESVYDEVSAKSSNSGSHGDYYTCASNVGSLPEVESIYEELPAMRQLSLFEGSDSGSSGNFDLHSLPESRKNVSRSESWSFYDTVTIVPRPKSEPYENVTLHGNEVHLKSHSHSNVRVLPPSNINSVTPPIAGGEILIPEKEHVSSRERQISQSESVHSSVSIPNELYNNWKPLRSVQLPGRESKSRASKSVIFEFDPLYENVIQSAATAHLDDITENLRETESLPPYNTLEETDDFDDDFDTASLPVPPNRFDSITDDDTKKVKNIPNEVEYYLYHRKKAASVKHDITDNEEISGHDVQTKSTSDSSPSESPERESSSGKRKTNLVRWTSMKRAIKMVADGSNWSPGVMRRISRTREATVPSEQKYENAVPVVERPNIKNLSGPLHSGFLFRSPSNGDKTKDFIQKWCQLAEGKLSYSVEKNGMNKDCIPLEKVLSIQIVRDIKTSNDGEDIHCMEISTLCRDRPHLLGSPGTTERRIWMQKLIESMTLSFPSRLTADYTRTGWCYLKEGIGGEWVAAWLLLQKRVLYHQSPKHSSKIHEIDLRKARCIVLQDSEKGCVNTSEPGPMILVDTPDQVLYLQMDNSRETKAWRHTIRAAAVDNGPTLTDQQLTKDDLPTIVDKCINFVYAHGSMSEGIYRRSGGNTSVTKLLAAFQKDAWAVQLTRQEYTEYEVATVLKRFFRELPEPLLTTQLHKHLCNAAGVSCTEEEKISLYRSLLEQLPPVNFVTTRRLMGHLYFIHQQRERNLMPVDNLAAIWGPTLMHVENGVDANWSKRESEVISDLISLYPRLFLVDSEELAREQRMQEVLEKYHNSCQQPPQPQKPSGDIKVWIHINSKDSGTCVSVTVGPQREAGDVCHELCNKMNVFAHELCLLESVLGGALIRPLHHSEKVLDTVLRWGYWDDADCKDNCLILVLNTILRDVAPLAKAPMAPSGELRFADLKSKSFKSYLFEFSQAKLSYYKDKLGSVKLGEWKIEDIVWYIGHEPKRNPQTRWAITFINKNNKPKRSKENPYFGWTLAGTTREEQLKWMAALLIGEFPHCEILPKPQLNFLE